MYLQEDVVESAPIEQLAGLYSRVLFYPCSGFDIELPITLFAPVIDVFWFIDLGYFRPGHQNTRDYGLDRPATMVSPIFLHTDFKYLNSKVDGPPTFDTYAVDVTPCILTEYYHHIPSGRTIELKFRRGYGMSAFDKEIEKLAVFFYRGDSMGEGGSGNHWFQRKREKVIWNKLLNRGWVVTDFSQIGGQEAFGFILKNIYEKRFTKVSDLLSPPFQYYIAKFNITFTCLGYLGYRYGPTMAFRMDRGDTREEGGYPNQNLELL